MIIPLLALAAIAIMILRYVIGFTCGRITRELGPFSGRQIGVIAVVWGCIFGLYVALGQSIAQIQ